MSDDDDVGVEFGGGVWVGGTWMGMDTCACVWGEMKLDLEVTVHRFSRDERESRVSWGDTGSRLIEATVLRYCTCTA